MDGQSWMVSIGSPEVAELSELCRPLNMILAQPHLGRGLIHEVHEALVNLCQGKGTGSNQGKGACSSSKGRQGHTHQGFAATVSKPKNNNNSVDAEDVHHRTYTTGFELDLQLSTGKIVQIAWRLVVQPHSGDTNYTSSCTNLNPIRDV